MSEKLSGSPIIYWVGFEMETIPSTLPTITLLGRGQEIGVFEYMDGLGVYSTIQTEVYFTPTIDDFSLMPSEDDNYIYQIVQEL